MDTGSGNEDGVELVPTVEKTRERQRGWHEPEPLVFEERACRPQPWEIDVDTPEQEVERAWIFSRQERYQKPAEQLFLSFRQPLVSGFPMRVPEGLVDFPQEGSWALLNPRTLCFTPASGAVQRSELRVGGAVQDIEGTVHE